MNNHFIELTDPKFSYMFGFVQCDGHMSLSTRNRGKLSIEIREEDVYILEEFAKIIPYHNHISFRTRDTNFKQNCSTVILTICDMHFREELLQLGLNYGKKSVPIHPPTVPFSERDYFRGIIDADGSLGITGNNMPFVSLVTNSDPMFLAYTSLIERITTEKKHLNRNKRDNIYNIVLFNEDAQKLVSYLYYKDCLALPRKIKAAQTIMDWIRPFDRKKNNFVKRFWTEDEDKYILHHPITDSINKLNRTEKSIKIRLWRLKK